MKKIECIIMDWAGTAADYRCFIPMAAFTEAFAEKGLVIDIMQTRRPMGLPKIQHIRELFSIPDVNEQFTVHYQYTWTKEDVVELNRLLEEHLFASFENYTDPVPGVIPTLGKLRAADIKIGSTIGCAHEMMDVVLPTAQAKGYHMDYYATPNLLSAGRPVPYMIFGNLMRLTVPNLDAIIEVGNTIADTLEGVNAGVCSTSMILSSNEVALTEAETKSTPASELEACIADVRERILVAGASYVIRTIEELPALVETVNAGNQHPGPHPTIRRETKSFTYLLLKKTSL